MPAKYRARKPHGVPFLPQASRCAIPAMCHEGAANAEAIVVPAHRCEIGSMHGGHQLTVHGKTQHDICEAEGRTRYEGASACESRVEDGHVPVPALDACIEGARLAVVGAVPHQAHEGITPRAV